MLNIRPSCLPPEMQLLLACCRTSAQRGYRDRIKTLNHGPINWEAFIKLVERHRLHPMVYRNLRSVMPNGLPEHVSSSLRNRFEENAQRALGLTAELVRLVTLLEWHGIPVIPLKGPVVALQAYGDFSLRHAGDLDLLVSPEQFERADRLLCQSGYERQNPGFALSGLQRKYSERIFHHSKYFERRKRVCVELQRRLLDNRYSFPIKFDELWAQSQNIIIAGTRIKTLSLEHTLLYLCVHGACHLWFRLFWLCDLAQLLHQNETIDWAGVMARATELSVQRPLVQGLILSNLLLHSPLPNPVRTYSEMDRMMPRLIKAGINGIIMRRADLTSSTSINTVLRQKVHEIKLRPDFRYKLRCLIPPLNSTQDWNILRLPDVLFPLYFILRPFLWFWRWHLKGPPQQGRNVASSARAKNRGAGQI